MASFKDRIAVLIEVGTGNSAATLKDLKGSIQAVRSEVGQAEGAMGKMRVVGGAAMGQLKGHVVEMAAAGAVALAAFAAKGVAEFQRLALSAGKFADAAGISTEAASRWIEVAGDVGVGAETISGAILKMEKAAGTTPAAFEALGVEIAKTRAGAVDANETFIRTLERLAAIKDPAERASAGAKLLGKSWGEMAEIIESGDIRGALEGVSDAKIIDADEVAKARAFRDAVDELMGVMEDLALTVGEDLVPALTTGAGFLASLAGRATEATGGIGLLDTAFSYATGGALGHAKAIAENNHELELSAVASHHAAAALDVLEVASGVVAGAVADLAGDAVDPMANSMAAAAKSAEVLTDQLAALIGEIDQESSFLELQGDIESLGDEFATLAGKVASGEMTQAQAMREGRLATLERTRSVLQYVDSLGNVPAETRSKIVTAIERGDLDEATRLLDDLTKPRTVNVRVLASGDLSGTVNGRRAAGGPVAAGGVYEVGEGNRPEILQEGGKSYLIPGNQGKVVPTTGARPLAGIGPSTSSPALNVTVNVAGSVTSERDLVQAVHEGLLALKRRSGDLGL